MPPHSPSIRISIKIEKKQRSKKGQNANNDGASNVFRQKSFILSPTLLSRPCYRHLHVELLGSSGCMHGSKVPIQKVLFDYPQTDKQTDTHRRTQTQGKRTVEGWVRWREASERRCEAKRRRWTGARIKCHVWAFPLLVCFFTWANLGSSFPNIPHAKANGSKLRRRRVRVCERALLTFVLNTPSSVNV